MTTDALWRIAVRLVLPAPKSTGHHIELMSNEDLDHWLEEHGLD
ncbi:MAG: hypothetical protein ABR992_08280 [Solirubrobacteraceae bacterium]|jgi:hypothetical protein